MLSILLYNVSRLFIYRIHIAICSNELFIIVEAVLAVALIGAAALVVQIDVHKAVTLGHLAGGLGDQVNTAPPGVADQVYAVNVDGIAHGLDVFLEVFDAVGVVHLAVLDVFK